MTPTIELDHIPVRNLKDKTTWTKTELQGDLLELFVSSRRYCTQHPLLQKKRKKAHVYPLAASGWTDDLNYLS